MNENELNKAKQMKDQLNAVGPGFCLAKWDQVTMHLHTGMTHSCHHPAPHKVNLEDLKRNPTAIHNSTQKLQERTAMLCGDRPSPCNYCWKMEDANPDAISDRYLKSANLFSNNFDLIASSGTGASYIPSYVEVSFSNACNLKCTYCGPTFSSKWQQEQEQNENIALYDLNSKERSWNYHNLDYLKSIDELPYKNSEHNPYVDAFWKWWPELRKNIKHLRITGGEPLMAKDTFRLLDELQKNPIPDLEFSLNTNLNAPEKNWQQLLDFIKRNEDEQLVKKITLYTSLDGWGEQAEYIRSGLDFNLLWERLLYLIEEHPSVDNSIMTTYSLLSVPNYKTLLENVLEVKQKYNRYNGILERRQEQYKDWFESVGQGSFFERNEIRCCAVHLDISTLSFPHFLSVAVLDREYSMPKLWKQYEFMAKHLTLGKDDQNFYDFETEKLGRVCDIAFYTAENEQDYNENLNYHRANFYMFINEMDKRRGTDFVKTFPELEDFYYSCKKSVDKLR
jgi:organic radical activating enzyme